MPETGEATVAGGVRPEERAPRAAIVLAQERRLAELLETVHGRNRFYTEKLDRAGIGKGPVRLPRDLALLPITTKSELVADQAAHPPWGTALTEPLAAYTRYCQTSSTTGRPLRWLDTNESWQWLAECWKAVFRAAGVGPGDRIFFPFSFGPFLGFWVAFDAGSQIGAHCVPGGGMSSSMRLGLIESLGVTVVCCTPTYALRLAEVAAEEHPQGPPLREQAVRVVIVAGEPGGSIPATRERIERSWGARVIDHHGLTELGPISFECWEAPGFLHLNEERFLCEVLDPATLEPLPDGERGELVVTSLGRAASPVLRYRTGDIVVRRSEPCACGRTWARLEGGILARADDMVNVRGVNVYPAAIEAIVRRFPEVVEFRSTVAAGGPLRALSLEIEPTAQTLDAAGLAARVAQGLREALGLTVPVLLAAPGSLPRFEMKARRFVVEERSR
ncbi:MAG TPA: AMP-binding protein [Vicinamibacteria bacterium]|nr:AMP-binding protein [Vicinamibacteria bacterium]